MSAVRCMKRFACPSGSGPIWTRVQQCRCYQPLKLPKKLQDRLNRHTKPFIPGETTDGDIPLQEFQLTPAGVQKYRRIAWAKHGSASGVDVASLIPSKEEIEAELEAERQWWPTLQQMQQDIKERGEQRAQKCAEYEKRVAENMAKMPQWIEEWKENQAKMEQRNAELSESRSALTAQAMEHFDYKYEATDVRIKEYVKGQVEKQKLLKKKAKQLAKQTRKT